MVFSKSIILVSTTSISIFCPGLGSCFIGSAEAEVTDKSFSAGQWIQDVRDWESEKNRTPIDETLNSALIMHEEELKLKYQSLYLKICCTHH